MPMLITFLMALAGMAFPFPAADAIGKRRHLVEHRMHVGNNIFPVDLDSGAARGPQRDVQHRPLLGDVDLLAAKHGIPPLFHPPFPGQLEQQAQGFVGNPILGVVQVQTGAFDGQPCPTLWVIGKQLPKMNIFDFLVVRLQGFPGGGIDRSKCGHFRLRHCIDPL